jgi:hypothetical protein
VPVKDVDASPNLRITYPRSLFHDSDSTDENDEGAEEFTGFTGGLEDMEFDEDEAEEYVPLLPSIFHDL